MEYKRLGDIATYINGYPFKPEDRGTEGLPIIRIQDLTGNSYDLGFYNGDYPERIEINDGDVLISWSASLGVYLWDRGKALLNQHIFKVVFDKCAVNKQYFIYAVQHKLKEMESKTHGATMKHIVKKDFDETAIPFPSLEQQAEISRTLSKTANIIAMRQQQLSALDDLIKARFVEMFTGQYQLVKLGEVVQTTSGGTPSKSHPEYYYGGTIPWLTSGEVNTGVITSVKNSITEDGMNNSSAKLVPVNSVVVAMYGATAGVTGILRVATTTNQAVCSLLPCEHFLPEYLYCAVAAKKDWMIAQSKGGGQPNISQGIIKSMEIIDAPIETQKEFVEFYNQIDKSKAVVQKALDKAQILFDSLMQQFFE